MKKVAFLPILFLIIFFCSKDKVPKHIVTPEKPWEKFEGHYKVYDTTGVYLYHADMEYFTKINSSGNLTDNIRIKNLLNIMDYEFVFLNNTNSNFLDLKINDSVSDYQNNHWFINTLYDDPFTEILENCLFNDKIVLYFRITNIKFYIDESVPYVNENIKHVFIKQ